MAYKARRTRDLQGEVKAGTGISVTEGVKPDGTKVYTLENTAPGVTITVSGEGLSLINNILRNVMAQEIGFYAADDNNPTRILWYDDNGDPVFILEALRQLIIADVSDGAGFFLKQELSEDYKQISYDIIISDGKPTAMPVSLITLHDLINSIGYYQFGVGSDNRSLCSNSVISISNQTDQRTNISGKAYYDIDVDSGYEYAGGTIYGIRIREEALYKIHMEIGIEVAGDQNTNTSIIDLYLVAIEGVGGNLRDIAYRTSTVVGISSGTIKTLYLSVETIAYLNNNDIVGFSLDTSPGTNYVSSIGDDPSIYIQKIRRQ